MSVLAFRFFRRLRGLTQEGLANQLGLTFQQVQKYETGSNRISASKMAAIADVLEVPWPPSLLILCPLRWVQHPSDGDTGIGLFVAKRSI